MKKLMLLIPVVLLNAGCFRTFVKDMETEDRIAFHDAAQSILSARLETLEDGKKKDTYTKALELSKAREAALRN